MGQNHHAMNKKNYKTPAILNVIHIEYPMHLLGGSVVDNVDAVMTTGQETDGFFDLSDGGSGFNHSWES